MDAAASADNVLVIATSLDPLVDVTWVGKLERGLSGSRGGGVKRRTIQLGREGSSRTWADGWE